jgi:hypothetical protein
MIIFHTYLRNYNSNYHALSQAIQPRGDDVNAPGGSNISVYVVILHLTKYIIGIINNEIVFLKQFKYIKYHAF